MPHQYGDNYPSHYADPDISDAENLTKAAYYLINAGYGDTALSLIQKICLAFQDVALNPKLKPPAKTLGEVRYLPCGILQIQQSPCNIEIPAPAYPAGDEAQQADYDRKATARRGSDACRHAYLGWFSSKQASAALAGRIPNTSSFRPAIMLEKITALCGAYDPAMPADAAVVLARKLKTVLDRNPLSAEKYTQLRQNLSDAGGGRYRYEDDGKLGFSYLSEAQTEIAADILEKDTADMANSLRQISENVIKWPECDRDAIRDIDSILEHAEEPVRKEIPFLASRYQAYYGNRGDFYGSDEYILSKLLDQAVTAIQDVNNLMRCHAALCRHKDEYLHRLLIDCKMIDEDLDASMPHDLWATAGILISSLVYAPKPGSGEKIDGELSRSAFECLPAVMARCGAYGRLDDKLLHPVETENQEQAQS